MAEIGKSPQIELTDISMGYKKNGQYVPAIESMSMTVVENSFVSLIGPSGCGKSSLLKVISGLVEIDRGEVLIEGLPNAGVDLTGRLSFMFQQPLLLPWRTALENVILPLEIVSVRTGKVNRSRAASVLDMVGLADAHEKRPHELSGGMRQRVALARALVTSPEILLMDEPFGAVDEITREALQGELLRIWQASTSTIVMVTHQIEEAILLSDQIVVMSKGPGRLLETVKVNIPRPRTADVRMTPEFQELADRLRRLLVE